MTISFWDGAAEQSAVATLWDGTSEQDVVAVQFVTPPNTIDNLFANTPFYVAHRGGSHSWPEMTAFAYAQATAWPMKAIEVSVNYSSDGVPVCIHDATTDAATGTSHTVASTPWSTLQTLTVSAANTNNPSQAGQPLARLETILDLYADDHVIFIEDKTYSHATQILNLMDTYLNPTSHFVWKVSGPGGGTVPPAKARGYKSWGYYFQADMPNFASTYSQYDYLGADFNGGSSNVPTMRATGKPVIGHIIQTVTDRNTMLGLGCVGIMASDIQAVVPH